MRFSRKHRSVLEIQILKTRRVWPTKSGGKLTVPVALPFGILRKRYFRYDRRELERASRGIRGLRIYLVRGLKKGKCGGGEFHRIREEIAVVLNGKVRWTFEDLSGARKVFTSTPTRGIWIPPFILHTYEAVEGGSGLLMVANTLYNVRDSKTHDTFSAAEFHKLQQRKRGSPP